MACCGGVDDKAISVRKRFEQMSLLIYFRDHQSDIRGVEFRVCRGYR